MTQLVTTVDVTDFMLVNAIDTCSIWNMLSSSRLLAAALNHGCFFVVAHYVRYEALEKARSKPTASDLAMQEEFRARLDGRKGFEPAPITIADLAAVANVPEVRRLGRGEIAAFALARKLRAAVMTDDQGARRAAPKAGVERAQTTPHLMGWLLYKGVLADGDVSDIIVEHEQQIARKQGHLTEYFRDMHQEAYRCRLLQQQSSIMAGSIDAPQSESAK